MAKETPHQKAQKVKAQVRKDIRSGKIAPGNSPNPSQRTVKKKQA